MYARKLFAALQLTFPEPVTVFQDNMSAIALVCGPSAHHGRTKHLETKYHFQRHLLADNIIRVQHQDTNHLAVDLLTKILSAEKTQLHARVLFGEEPMQVLTKRLPESQKWYIQRHNDELKQQQKVRKLKENYSVVENQKSASKKSKVSFLS